jgi:hypothetical protein
LVRIVAGTEDGSAKAVLSVVAGGASGADVIIVAAAPVVLIVAVE